MISDGPRNLSRYQYGTLKFINEHNVTMYDLRRAHANTLGSLAQAGFLRRIGDADHERIILTEAGQDALRVYSHASINARRHDQDLTDRCRRLLHAGRRVTQIPMRRSA